MRESYRVGHRLRSSRRRAGPAAARRLELLSGRGLPVERREVTVVSAARVVPVEPEDLEAAAQRAHEPQAAVRRMQRVVDDERLARPGGARDTFGRLIEHVRDGDPALQAILLEPDWLLLAAEERSHEGAEGGHRPARLAARDASDGLLLLGRGPLVDDQADPPVALGHDAGRLADHGEAEPIERDRAEPATVDLE